MNRLFSFCALLLAFNTFAQDANDRPLRDSFLLSLPVSRESVYESKIPSSAFIVGPQVLQLFPGETVYIEVEQKDGTITNVKSVKENKNPSKTLEISFMQNLKNNMHENMMLKVKNPFKRDLTYTAQIRLMKSGKWVETSIIPVVAGLFGYETWPDVIISIAMGEWKFL